MAAESRWLSWGLGKLGGHELNYVSDVDLIFLHSDAEGDGAARRSSPSAILQEGTLAAAPRREDFIMLLSRLAHRLTRLLSDRFEGDRVFQVDLRLRPQARRASWCHP